MTAKRDRAVVLVSGGADSAVLLADALKRYRSVTPLYIRNGLSWERAELIGLKKFLKAVSSPKLNQLEILSFDSAGLYGRHWSVTRRGVPGSKTRDAAVYLPGRNVLLLSQASVFAALRGISNIEIGVLKSNPFPDGNRAFFRKFSRVLSEGLGVPIRVNAPLAKLTKRQTMERGKGLPLELTFSCLRPRGIKHCGKCNKCAERIRVIPRKSA